MITRASSVSSGPLDRCWNVELIDAVAYVPVSGPICRSAPMSAMCPPYEDWTSETGMVDVLGDCLEDERAGAVVLRLDSPGGESYAMPAIMRALKRLAAAKPVVAFVDHEAYSAAYWIAAVAHSIWLASGFAGVGSIGTVVRVLDNSEHLAKEGLKVVHVTDAPKKAKGDGVPFDESERADTMRQIAPISAAFVADVSAGRQISAEEIVALEGGCLYGAEAIRLGLADAIVERADVHEKVLAMLDELSRAENGNTDAA